MRCPCSTSQLACAACMLKISINDRVDGSGRYTRHFPFIPKTTSGIEESRRQTAIAALHPLQFTSPPFLQLRFSHNHGGTILGPGLAAWNSQIAADTRHWQSSQRCQHHPPASTNSRPKRSLELDQKAEDFELLSGLLLRHDGVRLRQCHFTHLGSYGRRVGLQQPDIDKHLRHRLRDARARSSHVDPVCSQVRHKTCIHCQQRGTVRHIYLGR
jgi:hypothetical protein